MVLGGCRSFHVLVTTGLENVLKDEINLNSFKSALSLP